MVNSRSYLEISTFTWIEIFTPKLGHNATDSHSSCLTNSIFTISRLCRAEGCAKRDQDFVPKRQNTLSFSLICKI